MGNPHLVVLVRRSQPRRPGQRGPWLETHFAEGINVEFIAPAGPRRARPAGVGARRRHHPGVRHRRVRGGLRRAPWGLVGERVRVDMPGGSAEVELGRPSVTLIGPSTHVATIEIPDA